MLVRILTFNIRHGLGLDGRIDLDRTLEVIQSSGADVIALNEVDKYRIRSGFTNQTKWLAKKLGFHHSFAVAHRGIFACMGNAILSKFPILKDEIIQLTSTREPRLAIKALIGLENQGETMDLNCICTHFGLSSDERQIQAREVMDVIYSAQTKSKLATPLILMGDLNALPESAEVKIFSRELIDVMQDKIQPTFPAQNPQARIDYIFMSKNCAIIEANVLASTASDHLAVFAAVEVK